MKVLAVIFLIVGISLTQGSETDDKFRAELDKVHQQCLPTTKLELQILEKAKKGEIDENNTVLMDHIFCVCEHYGIVKDNKLQPEAIKKFAESQERGHSYEDVANKCKHTQHENIKVYLIKYAKCAMEHAPKGSIII